MVTYIASSAVAMQIYVARQLQLASYIPLPQSYYTYKMVWIQNFKIIIQIAVLQLYCHVNFLRRTSGTYNLYNYDYYNLQSCEVVLGYNSYECELSARCALRVIDLVSNTMLRYQTSSGKLLPREIELMHTYSNKHNYHESTHNNKACNYPY